MSSEPSERPSGSLAERLKLVLILETSLIKLPLGDFVMQAVEGGVSAIRYRDKTMPMAHRYETAKQIASILKGTDTLLIINNNADLAVAAGAHGVHVGQADLPPDVVKQCFPNLIVGYTCHNEDDCKAATSANVDYISIGPVFQGVSRQAVCPILGVENMDEIARAAKTIPSVAIGGIDLTNISKLRNTFISGACVSSALCNSDTPYDVALELRSRLEGTYKEKD